MYHVEVGHDISLEMTTAVAFGDWRDWFRNAINPFCKMVHFACFMKWRILRFGEKALI